MDQANAVGPTSIDGSLIFDLSSVVEFAAFSFHCLSKLTDDLSQQSYMLFLEIFSVK